LNLKYNILWFEDDPEVVETQVGPEIKTHLEQLGFEYLCTHKEEGENLDVITNDKKFDLILTDLNLEEDEIGKRIVERIRNDKIYTEVILYSQNANAITKIINDPDHLIERVSFAVGIDNLANRANRIIDLTLKKVQDVTNMRGLVIASAIDLEIMMEELIKDFFTLVGNKAEDQKREEILKSIYDNKIKRDKEYLEEIMKLDHTNIDLLLEKGILTASNIYDAIMTALKIVDQGISAQLKGLKDKVEQENIGIRRKNIKDLRDKLQRFQSDIISLRNTLAHVKEEINAEGIPYLKNQRVNGEIILFDDNKYIAIRKNFLNYSQIMVEIKAILN
jgi:CheY-like chemotaxis protein